MCSLLYKTLGVALASVYCVVSYAGMDSKVAINLILYNPTDSVMHIEITKSKNHQVEAIYLKPKSSCYEAHVDILEHFSDDYGTSQWMPRKKNNGYLLDFYVEGQDNTDLIKAITTKYRYFVGAYYSDYIHQWDSVCLISISKDAPVSYLAVATDKEIMGYNQWLPALTHTDNQPSGLSCDNNRYTERQVKEKAIIAANTVNMGNGVTIYPKNLVVGQKQAPKDPRYTDKNPQRLITKEWSYVIALGKTDKNVSPQDVVKIATKHCDTLSNTK